MLPVPSSTLPLQMFPVLHDSSRVAQETADFNNWVITAKNHWVIEKKRDGLISECLRPPDIDYSR